MIVLWMTLLFAAACALAWLVAFPETRQHLSARARHGARAALEHARRFRQSVFRRPQASVASHRIGAWRFAGFGGGQRWLPLALLLVIALPPLLVLGLRREVVLEGFDGIRQTTASSRIEELLRGERLVPPPPPPPEVFMTAEVEAVRPMTATADRKWEQLDPEFTQRLLAVYRVMREQHGYDMVLVEGYRSPRRQEELAARGGHVTRARAGQSWHQHGLAADSAFLREGKLVISEKDPWAMRGYQLYGQVSKEAGLVWGGDWRSIQDLMHVELRREGVMRR
ncbi:MAG TPA: M15 family metallopeptidase [Luteimonas sp.]|nr:M15 family metallopeptidase [Luteimonas sp.]